MPTDRHAETLPATGHAYRPDIDGLRAIAVSAVVLFHALPWALPGGFAGVDVFFVISGFLIGGILIDTHAARTFTYRDFYARRVRRLFPALAVVLLAVLAAGLVLQVPSDFRLLGKHVLAGAGFASNLVLMREAGYFDTASALKPLLHLWSLGVEEQFYILCPLLLALAWRLRVNALVIIVVVALASFVAGLHWLDVAPNKAYFHPASRFWELFAGVALAAMLRTPAIRARLGFIDPARAPVVARGRWLVEAVAVAGLALLATGFAILDEGRDFPGWLALLPVGGSFLLIAAGAHSRVARVLLANRAMVFIGLISYPLYLWHWPLFSFARIYLRGEELPTVLALGLAALAVLLAWLTWRFVETPLRHARGPFPVTRVLVIAVALLALTGAVVYKTHGLAWRYPQDLRGVAALDYKGKREARVGECFMNTEQTKADFGAACTRIDSPAKHPVVLLWGDSHGAHLYPGLSALANESPGFTLLQLTASGCPPVPGLVVPVRPACRDINDFVLAEARRLKPDVVVLAGFWMQYAGNAEWPRVEPSALAGTVRALREAGVGRVVLVGQVPVWTEPQPRLVLRLWEERGLIVDRTDIGLVREVFGVDAAVRAIAAEAGATFVSPIETFCEDGRCMTFSGPERREPVAFDYGHLTQSGSLRLARRIVAAFAVPPAAGAAAVSESTPPGVPAP